MSDVNDTLGTLIDRNLAAPRSGRRRLVALTGPPASGKSTLSALLADRLNAADCPSCVIPMDGFHLDNRILSARGLLDRKGSPESFDVGGLRRLVSALPHEGIVYFPSFDRAQDIAIAGSGVAAPEYDTVIVEGNYLLYDAPGWRELSKFWDLSVRLNVPQKVLQQRLVERWLTHGLTFEQAQMRTRENDLVNAELIAAAAMASDLTIGL